VLAAAEAYHRSRHGVWRLLGERRPVAAAREAGPGLAGAPGVALAVGLWATRRHLEGLLRRRLKRPPPQGDRVPFGDLDPAARPAAAADHPLLARLRALEAREEGFVRDHPAGEAGLAAAPRRRRLA
jgi:hypothetical protein